MQIIKRESSTLIPALPYTKEPNGIKMRSTPVINLGVRNFR